MVLETYQNSVTYFIILFYKERMWGSLLKINNIYTIYIYIFNVFSERKPYEFKTRPELALFIFLIKMFSIDSFSFVNIKIILNKVQCIFPNIHVIIKGKWNNVIVHIYSVVYFEAIFLNMIFCGNNANKEMKSC